MVLRGDASDVVQLITTYRDARNGHKLTLFPEVVALVAAGDLLEIGGPEKGLIGNMK